MKDLLSKMVLMGKSTLEVLINFVFPRKESAALFVGLTETDIAQRARHSDGSSALFDYHDPLIHSLIWHVKYKGDALAVTLIGTLMQNNLYEEIAERLAFNGGGKALLIPIPESKKRRLEKGFNQVALIGEVVAAKEGTEIFELNSTLLKRQKEVARQTDLKKRTERLKNMKDVFTVTDPAVLKDRVLVLIDDVTTTGATLSEARKVLEKAEPAHIEVLAFAH